ncbi:fbd-associated f-box protein, partial [Quercus suber]
VVLHLSGGIELDPPPSFQLPCLKKLCLLDVFYCYEDSLSRLFNGCPVLEDLKVIRNNSDDRVFKLLRALNNAKFLSLSPGDIEVPKFVNKSNWHVLQALLLVAPNLEVLDVHKEASGPKLLWFVSDMNVPAILFVGVGSVIRGFWLASKSGSLGDSECLFVKVQKQRQVCGVESHMS